MARDSESSEAKSKLKFFKNAKAQNEPPVPEGAEPTASATQAAVAVAADPADSSEAPAEAASPEVANAEAGQPEPEQPETPVAGKRSPKRVHLNLNLGGVFASSLAIAVRALVILAIISAGAVAAAFVVAKVIGPMVAKAQVAEVRKQIEQITITAGGETAKAVAQSGEGGGSKPKGRAGGHGSAGGFATEIKDLVVNPAETDGTRYVCTSVALEASTSQAAQEVAARESQVRDALIEILGARTVSELSNLEVRDEIREEIRESVNRLVSQGSIEAVYFSNFVLQ